MNEPIYLFAFVLYNRAVKNMKKKKLSDVVPKNETFSFSPLALFTQ